MPGLGRQFNWNDRLQILRLLIQRLAIVLAAMAAATAAHVHAQCAATRWDRVAVIGGGFAVAEGAAIVARGGDWWPEPAGAFHFDARESPSNQQDRLLHAAVGYQTAQLGRLAWRWACVSEPAAAWLGAALGVAVGLPKEIGDGLQPNKGFDVPDMLYTAAGSILPALHQSVPTTRPFQLKVQYGPSDEYRSRMPGGLPQIENDYAGQRYYLAIDPGLLPNGAGPWPDWLGVAVGHSVDAWASVPPSDEWFVTLDVNARGFPIRAQWWRTVASLIDQIHVPMPGLKIHSGEIRLGLY